MTNTNPSHPFSGFSVFMLGVALATAPLAAELDVFFHDTAVPDALEAPYSGLESTFTHLAGASYRFGANPELSVQRLEFGGS